jgi:hypothetical protein
MRQKITIDTNTANAPLDLAVLSNLPTGTFPPNTIPCIPYAKSSVGAIIDRNKCPAAVESEEGTVQDEIKTSMNPETDSVLPRFFDLPLIVSHIPRGTKSSGIQNQMAASTMESMVGRRHRDL